MTPPLLRTNVVFVHGNNRNKSVTFTQKQLPKKSEIREPGNRTLAKAIFTTFVHKEKSLSNFFVQQMRKMAWTNRRAKILHQPSTSPSQILPVQML